MVLFNLKQRKTQILSEGSTLNQMEACKKNYQGHPTNSLVKHPETTMPKLHATYPMTLNFQTHLKKMLKRFYLASISVKPLEWTKIPTKFLKDGAEVLGLPLEDIINLSRKLSTFPEDCKIAKLKPLFIKGARTDPKNHCPISL